MEKIKVVLLGHLSSPQIREHLPLVYLRNNSFVQKYLKMGRINYPDFASWNINTIEGFEKIEEVEMHVIAPHQGLRYWSYEYIENRIHYHFFRPEPLFPLNKIEKIFYKNQYKNYPRTRRIVRNFIKKIRPDIVNLVGAENPYYSICGLDIDNIPLFITCQTVYSNPNRKRLSGTVSKYRCVIEQALFRKAYAFCCTNTMYRELIKSYVPDAIVFPLTWPDKTFPKLSACEKKFDFAFFSMSVSKKKGIDSAIDALIIVKRHKPNVTLLVVGHTDTTIIEDIQRKIKEYNLQDNVIFHDFFPSQIEMFNYVHQARYALLPVKMDFISGTILQAMEMGMPVITHITSGTPTLNAERETVLLSEIGDVETMAAQMLRLIDDERLARKLSENGQLFMQERHKKASKAVLQRLEQYKVIIKSFSEGKAIPSEFLKFD